MYCKYLKKKKKDRFILLRNILSAIFFTFVCLLRELDENYLTSIPAAAVNLPGLKEL